jgi:hypothetical protein
MIFENIRRAMVLVQIFVDGLPGPEKMVMNGTNEDINGPLISKVGGIYLPIPGRMIVADVGSLVAQNVICVGDKPVTKFWAMPGGQLCTILVRDFRCEVPQRQYR